jgi:hypothetical protein
VAGGRACGDPWRLRSKDAASSQEGLGVFRVRGTDVHSRRTVDLSHHALISRLFVRGYHLHPSPGEIGGHFERIGRLRVVGMSDIMNPGRAQFRLPKESNVYQ